MQMLIRLFKVLATLIYLPIMLALFPLIMLVVIPIAFFGLTIWYVIFRLPDVDSTSDIILNLMFLVFWPLTLIWNLDV